MWLPTTHNHNQLEYRLKWSSHAILVADDCNISDVQALLADNAELLMQLGANELIENTEPLILSQTR